MAVCLWENEEYAIRPGRTDEFRDIWWSFMQGLGWNRGYYDLDTYMNQSLGPGMLLLIEKSTGKPVGHVAAVINSNSSAWVSMFIIDEKHRGKGLGRELFKAADADAAKRGIKYLGLDGVVEQKQTSDGFEDERRDFVSSPLGTIRIMIRNLNANDPVPEPDAGHHIIPIRQVPRELLVQHELKYTGFERPELWSDKHMFNRKDLGGVAIVTREDPQSLDDLKAWTVTRRCSGGVRIGPLYASDHASAKAALLSAIQSATPASISKIPLPNEAMNEWSEDKIRNEAMVVTEVWGGNSKAVQLFEELGWKGVGVEYYRMWKNNVATPEQSAGGSSQTGVYSIFDAAIG